MARKSVEAELAAGVAAHIDGRLPVPDDLNEAEAKIWQSVVDSRPSEWFAADNAPLLKEYVRAAVMCDEIAVRLSSESDASEQRRLLRMRDRESHRLAFLATKMRLTQQSRYTPHSAAARTVHTQAQTGRPWDKRSK